MVEVLNVLREQIEVKKANYFLFSAGFAYYEIVNKVDFIRSQGYKEIIEPALNKITETLRENSVGRNNIAKFLHNEEPYLEYLLNETSIETEIVILSYFGKSINVTDIFTYPLENLPEKADEKYGILLLNNEKYKANHQGIYLGQDFYYYNPLLRVRRDAKTPPKLVELLLHQIDLSNTVSVRLDNTLSINKEDYKPFFREFFEVYHGREINLEEIHFPLHKGGTEYFCVYDPKTMKKIQFKLTHTNESEKWIEAEELWSVRGKEKQKMFMTRYLHSIYNPSNDCFEHVDGSINFYIKDNYMVRQNQQINAHADLHIKQWLVEGNIDILDWGKLVLYFFDDSDLILDAFKGNVIEEIFDEIE